MDTYSSGEELLIKTRKPYTITKQRERWTEEEHNRFLEALKLYGRAWQRIEDHIGTKTAVQIRSHAQKFFAKLEKEALVKGVPVGQARDIEIPPPRPKRKQSNSYPRKISVGAPSPHVGAKDGKKLASSPSRPTKHLLDLEKEPLPEKPGSDEKLEDAKENQVEVNFEVFKLFQGAPNTSPCPKNKKYLPTVGPSKNSCTFRECAPILNEVINAEETNESHVTVNHEGNQKLDKTNCRQSFQDAGICIVSNTGNSQSSHEKLIQEETREKSNEPKNFGLLSTNGMQANQNYPRHVPVHILDGNEGMDEQNTSPDFSCQESIFQKTGGIHGQPNQFANPVLSTTTEHNASAARSSIHQSFPIFHPLSPPTHSNQNDYRSFFHTSSTFSSLIVSALLQNPAAHAAASFAATFWPLANVETSVDSRAGALGSFSSRQISSAPSMAALAAATVASATAWWTAHGLLPLCAPFHTGLTSCTQSAAVTPMDNNKTRAASNGRREPRPDPVLKDRQLEAEYSEALQEQHSASKAPILSDSEATEGAKLNTGLPANNNEQAAAVTEHNDLNTTKTKKLLDRSSCGSNTPSSSEVETDALDKLKKGKEESKEPDIIPSGDTSYRRGRSSINSSDSWKEVSEGGRLAFQALFSREVLPQSFSPHDMKNKTHQKNSMEMTKQSDDLKAENASQLDLNSKTWGTSSQGTENNPIMRDENIGYGSILTMGPGHVKLKAYRTGFKPYKRCSVEAKESRMVSANSQDEEKGAKRIRLEG